jgi:hypothetical protein
VSIYFQAGSPVNIAVKIAVITPVVIAGDATKPTIIDWIQCTEIVGGVANLTIDLYDGTTAVYLRNAVAMTAKQQVLLTQGIHLNPGQYLRVTASIANNVDVVGVAVQKTR